MQDAKDAKEKAEKDRLEAEDAAAEAKGEFIEVGTDVLLVCACSLVLKQCGCCFTEHPWRVSARNPGKYFIG